MNNKQLLKELWENIDLKKVNKHCKTHSLNKDELQDELVYNKEKYVKKQRKKSYL